MARPANLANYSTADLQRVIADRHKQIKKLMGKRDKIARQLDDMDQQIARLGGDGTDPRRVPGTRAKNDRPLPEYIEDALAKAGKPMRVKDIVVAVQEAGYKSNSPKFQNIVNQQLIKLRKRFASVDRGTYSLVGKK